MSGQKPYGPSQPVSATIDGLMARFDLGFQGYL